jgi:hypothetical protein
MAAAVALPDFKGFLGVETLLDLGVVLALKVFIGAATYTLVHTALWFAVGRPVGFEEAVLDIANRQLGAFFGRV